jgi:hypothetical protein
LFSSSKIAAMMDYVALLTSGQGPDDFLILDPNYFSSNLALVQITIVAQFVVGTANSCGR